MTMSKTFRIGFLGAGGIAQAHAYALDALKYYYKDAPQFTKAVVASPTPKSREGFAVRFGFEEAIPPEAVWERDDLEALYILGPNHTHTPQLLKAAQIPNIKRIYVEKPIGTSRQDIAELETLEKSDHGKFIMMGFQFLQKSPIRHALVHWREDDFGDPVHFKAEYLHSSYLNPAYRQKRQDRLLPIPINGAAADLGSHILSLLTAFLGDSLVVKSAASGGEFADVPHDTDLCTITLLEETTSGAVGTVTASRVSAGAGDQLSLELRGKRGAIAFDTSQPDVYESYLPDEDWRRHEIQSDYLPASKFPSDYLPSGWLRALVHNHYLFLGGNREINFIPDLSHGIQVQRLLQQIADFILK
jgi:predicted dehydrogenase